MIEIIVIFESDSFIVEKEQFDKVNPSDYEKGSNHLCRYRRISWKKCVIFLQVKIVF